MPARRLTLLQQAAIWVWIAAAAGVIFARGSALGLDRWIAGRLRVQAIPVALSVLYHGRVHDYTAFKSVAASMRAGDTIATVAFQPIPPDDGTYYWAADDRGMADYVIGAFALLGPRVESLYWLYFVLLAASLVLFLADLGRHAAAAALLIFAMAALYVCLPVIPLGNLTLPIFEVGSLFEPRVFELLSYVAALHLGLTAWFDDRWTPGRRAIVAAQALLWVACYHARSSIGWQLIFVVVANGARWWSGRRRPDASGAWTRVAGGIAWPTVALALSLALLTVYQRATFNPRYFADMGRRTVWHNALMGLSWSDKIVREYHLQVDDPSVVEAVRRYFIATGDRHLSSHWAHTDILATGSGEGESNWTEYESAAREFYLYLWRTEPAAMIRCYAVAKPVEIARIAWRSIRPQPGAVSGLGPAAPVDGLGFNPFSPMALLLILPGLVLAYLQPSECRVLCVSAVALLMLSLIPGLVFYPVVHTMMGAFASVSLLCYLLIAAAITRIRHVDVPVH